MAGSPSLGTFAAYAHRVFACQNGIMQKTANSSLVVYLANPLGFAESTRSFLYERLLPAIENTGIKVINPWQETDLVREKFASLKRQTELNVRRGVWKEVVNIAGEVNARAIESADGIVAVLDGPDVDSGTAAEIGYGAALGKWIIGYRGDLRRTGEDEAANVNLQVDYFIHKNRGLIVHTVDELVDRLREIFANGGRKWSKSQVSVP